LDWFSQYQTKLGFFQVPAGGKNRGEYPLYVHVRLTQLGKDGVQVGDLPGCADCQVPGPFFVSQNFRENHKEKPHDDKA
jgi:hypothetical protein